MDLRVTDGYVYTDGRVVKEDVGIRDGEVIEIGDVEAGREIDATGCLVLPGLVNAHTHASMTLLRGYADDMPLEKWLKEEIWPAESELKPWDIEVGARLAMLEMIKSGTTLFGDMYFHMERVAKAVEESGLRANLGYGIITEGKNEEEIKEEVSYALEFAKEYDGTANGRLKSMITPHAPYTCSNQVLRDAAQKAEDLGYVLHTHLSETAGEVERCVTENGVRPARHLQNQDFWGPRSYVAHAVHLDKEEISLLSDQDVSVAHCPSANMKLASGAAPIAEMIDSGLNVAIGTDGPASNNDLDMFEELRLAALVAKLTEKDASTVPAGTALDMATKNGAYALGTNTGSIEPGRPADLAIVDLDAPHLKPTHDLVSHAVYAAHGGDVTATIVDGEVLMEDLEVKTLDEEKVLSEAEEASEALVSRVEESVDGG